MPCPDCSPSADYERVELVWPGKGKPVERVSLPFQTIERVNDVRRSREGQAALSNQSSRARENPHGIVGGGADTNNDRSEGVPRYDVATGRDDLPDWWVPGWRNRLIWGDNAQVLSSLMDDFAGRVDLIYIDPPFATDSDFSYSVKVGDQSVKKQRSIYEEAAFRDTWGVDGQAFAMFLFERLTLLRDLLNQDHGSIFLRLDYRQGARARMILDEVFGRRCFRNEIAVSRTRTIKAESGRFHHATDSLFFYSMGRDRFNGFRKELPRQQWAWVPMHMVGERKNKALLTVTIDGQEFTAPTGRRWMLSQSAMDNAWQRGLIRIDSEKNEPLFHKKNTTIGSNWTDIPGYSKRFGYPTENHEEVLERVIQSTTEPGDLVLDCFVGSGTTAAVSEKLSRSWIAVDIGRFAIQTTRKRLLDIPGCRPFEVQNLGRYERKYWQNSSSNNGDGVADYIGFVLDLYEARQTLNQHQLLHGVKGDRAVHVGATDSPVTQDEIDAAVQECADAGFTKMDVLGWEFEMGLNSDVPETRQHQLTDVGIRLFRIPREILDQRNIDAGGVNFFELSVAEAQVNDLGNDAVSVELTYFMPVLDDYMREKLTKIPENEFDWIDYWSVDFEYDGVVFVNQWQAYRTRSQRKLALVSDPHEYADDSPKTIVVKIIDIFGNDTTLQLERPAD